MNNKATEHNPGASDSARLFCTQISSAVGVVDELCTTPSPRARVREDAATRSESALAEWRTKTFGGNFDPVRAVV